MKRLILVRHAKSSWDDSSLDDHDRPLGGRGERDAPHMAVRLGQHGAAPEQIVTSTARRALETARALAEGLQLPEDRIVAERALYLATPGEILDVVARRDDDLREIALVGHNPGMTQLVNLLLPALRLHNLPTTGVVAIDFDGARWSELTASTPELAYYDYPKNPISVLSPD